MNDQTIISLQLSHRMFSEVKKAVIHRRKRAGTDDFTQSRWLREAIAEKLAREDEQ